LRAEATLAPAALAGSRVAEWLREENLESVVPNAPKITGGEVIVKEMNGELRA